MLVSAAWISSASYVLSYEGVIPAFARAWYVSSPFVIRCQLCQAPKVQRKHCLPCQKQLLKNIKTHLEDLDRPREEIHHLVSLTIVLSVARRRQRVDARAVLAPLVLPEVLGRPAIRQPVRAHVRQQVDLPGALEDGRDAAVGWRLVAERRVAAVAEVGPGEMRQMGCTVQYECGFGVFGCILGEWRGAWRGGYVVWVWIWVDVPETMQGPTILRPDSRAGVPELGLE